VVVDYLHRLALFQKIEFWKGSGSHRLFSFWQKTYTASALEKGLSIAKVLSIDHFRGMTFVPYITHMSVDRNAPH
jgi:hypothetical protein